MNSAQAIIESEVKISGRAKGDLPKRMESIKENIPPKIQLFPSKYGSLGMHSS
jgi:hypothetical protein